MKRFCQALDLVDDPEKIKLYQQYHENIWPEVAANIKRRGIKDMQIWQVENRLFMIMEVADDFNPEEAQEITENDPVNEKWEALMSQFQKPLGVAKSDQKWVEMTKIFDLSDCR